MRPRTLFEKVWDQHVVVHEPDSPAVLYVDLHLLHEVTSPQAFAALDRRGLGVRRPELSLATMDHSTPTTGLDWDEIEPQSRRQLETLAANCERHGIRCLPIGHRYNGIVHVVGPELGLSQPGQTIVCGDSHTSTHGAFGALAFGIGTTEVEHVLATQCLLQAPPRTLELRIEGELPAELDAKDMVLAICQQVGIDGATGHVIEYTGAAVRALDMEGRMTLCNMSVELGARAGMIAPDETTFEYLRDRPHAPQGAEWDRALSRWSDLRTDEGARYSRELTIDVSALEPMVSWGTDPGMSQAIDAPVPRHGLGGDADLARGRAAAYMGFEPGAPILGAKVDVVFIGSCTNSRITDLRRAASVLTGRHVAHGVRLIVVPGSQSVRRQAEREGLDRIFELAGAEWRQPGCSMCIAMNGDRVGEGELCVSTSNRNFEGRQGTNARTVLASPATAAAAAVAGRIADHRLLDLEGAPA